MAVQNQVTILNRRDEFARIKDGNQAALLKAFRDPESSLECRYKTSIEEIKTSEGEATRMAV